MSTVDNLDIQISTSLVNSNQQLDALIAKLNRVNSSLTGVKGSIKSISGEIPKVSKSGGGASKTFGGIASAIGKFYASCFLAIRGVKSLGKAIKSTADYMEAFNYFEVSFNKIGSDWGKDFKKYGYENAEEYAKSFNERAKESLSKLSGVQISLDKDGKGLLTDTGMKNLGLNIQEITQYASQLASVTNSVGQTGEVSLATANAFTKLAGDISSLFNQDYSAVAKNLQSGLIGQSRALYKYGIDITNATLQQKAYELGLSKSVSEMTQAEKMQLRMLVILRDSKVAWGDLANTINSPSNMLRQFKNNLKEVGMILGQLFIPILENVLPFINGVSIAIKTLLVDIAGFFGVKLDLSQFGQGGSDAEDTFDGISNSLDGVTKSAKKAKAGLRGFDELKTINAPKSKSSGNDSGAGSTIDLTNEILNATEQYQKVWDEAYNKMETKANKIAKKIGKIFKPIEKLFKDISVGDWFAIGEDVSTILLSSGIRNFLNKAIKEVDWDDVGTKFGDFFEGSVRRVFKELPLIGDFITNIVTSINTFLSSAINSVNWKKTTEDLLKGLQGFLKNLNISEIIDTVTDLINSINDAIIDVIDYLMKNPDEVIKLIGLLVAKILELIFKTSLQQMDVTSNLVSGILKSIFTTAIENGVKVAELAKKLKEKFKEAFEKIKDGDFNLKVTISDLGAKLVEKWKKASKFFMKNAPELGFKIGDFAAHVKEKMEPLKEYLKKKAEELSALFKKYFSEPVSKIFEGVVIIIKAVFNPLVSWFKNKVSTPLKNTFTPLKKDITDTFKNALSSVKEKWKEAKDWFKEKVGNPLGKQFAETAKSIETPFDNVWKSIKKGAVSCFNVIISAIEIGINAIIKSINSLLSGFNKAVSWAANITGDKWDNVGLIKQVSLKRINVDKYETGGFPKSADLFWANENGVPELVGTMGGRTAVASGTEITGIRDAIFATGQQETSLMATMVGLLRVIADKDYGITDDQIGKSAQRFAKTYFNRTGNEAYSF